MYPGVLFLDSLHGDFQISDERFRCFSVRMGCRLVSTSLLILLLISGPLSGQRIFDPLSIGPPADDLLEALQLDLDQQLGAEISQTMHISWIRDSDNGRVYVGWEQRIRGYSVRGSVGRSVAYWNPTSGIWSVRYRAISYIGTVQLVELIAEPDATLEKLQSEYLYRYWSDPALEVVPGTHQRPTLCWVIEASSSAPETHSSLRFDIDAGTLRILSVEEQMCEVDVPGTVSVVRTPGTQPQGGSAGQVFPLPGALISGGGATTLSNPDGSFLLQRGTGTNFTVQAGLEGTWGGVTSQLAPNATASAAADPNGVDLLINPGDDSNLTAQANAFHYVEQGYRYFTEAAGGFPAMSTPVNATTGMTGSCNAFYDPAQQMLRFLRPGGGCVDSAYSSVVLHEFGHHVVDSLGLVQGAFGEGYGDSLAVVYFDDGIIGRDFAGPGQHVRNIETAGVTHPCSGAIHFCGQALAGFWFDVGSQMRAVYGNAAGAEMVRELFVDWSSITLGGQGSQAIHDDTILEVLTADDNDGNLGNGTPNWDMICNAATVRLLSCPDLTTLTLVLTAGPGETVPPGQASSVVVGYTEVLASPVAGGSNLFWRSAGGAWQSVPLTETSPGVLEGTFPALQCLESVDWYVGVVDDLGFNTTLPEAGVLTPYSTVSATGSELILQETLANDPGWSTSDPSDAALFGLWEWGVPAGSVAQASEGVPGPGGDQSCYVTGLGSPGDAQGVHDVDFGETTLTTNSLSLSPTGSHIVSYWRWFSNNTSITLPDDILTIWKSLDGGSTWQVVETIGPGGPEASGGWFQSSFWIEEGESPTDSVRLKFRTGDLGAGSVTEAGIDLLEITQISCTGGPPPPPPVDNDFSRGDCNVDGQRDISDVVQTLEVLFGSQTDFPCADACDFNDGGGVDLSDVLLLLQEIFNGGTGAGSPVCGADPTADALGCEQGTNCP